LTKCQVRGINLTLTHVASLINHTELPNGSSMPDRLDPTFVRAQIESLRISHPGIWDDGDEQLLLDSLEGETDFHRFLTAVVRRMRASDGLAAGAAAEVEELVAPSKARQQRFEQRSEAMRTLAFKLMTAAEVRKVELPLATLSIRPSQRKVIVTDEAAIPDQYCRIKREPNKPIIKEHIEQGINVPGAELSNREDVLAVRVK